MKKPAMRHALLATFIFLLIIRGHVVAADYVIAKATTIKREANILRLLKDKQ